VSERGQARTVTAFHAVLIIKSVHSIDADEQYPTNAVAVVEML
jgi:hypothetical protein